MTPSELAGLIDLTLLNPCAARRDVEGFARDALKYPFAALFVPPCRVALAKKLLKHGPTKVGTVAGFPLGFETTGTKVREAREAVDAGAGEIDMVMNLSAFKSGEDAFVEDEVRAVVSAVPEAVVKVIIESYYLDDEEKKRACGLVIGGGAGFVKTSTGFAKMGADGGATGGATVHDVRVLVKAAAGRIRVKASGGIKTLRQTIELIEAGAARIGTSSGLGIVEELEAGGGF